MKQTPNLQLQLLNFHMLTAMVEHLAFFFFFFFFFFNAMILGSEHKQIAKLSTFFPEKGAILFS
jgi:hypothetical protein